MTFFPINDFSLLESCQLDILAKYKASNCCKIEAVIHRWSVKKVFLKVLQNSQKKPCARVSCFNKVAAKKETFALMFSREYCKIFKNTFFYRTPPVAASGKIRTKSLKLAKF